MEINSNAKITVDMVEKSYEIGKQLYNEQISLKDGINELKKIGMNSNSAVDYVYNYSNLIQGKLFTRVINSFGTEYYLNKIYQENGKSGLEKALLSLSQNIDYYEGKSGSKVIKRRQIYNKFLSLLDIDFDNVIFPDEVDSNQKYAEGKTKQVLINIYERNPIARKECIDYHGAVCKICEFNFENKYGEIGKGFIHVHHLIELASIGDEYSVNPILDLVPVCPNCHAMLHKRMPAFSVEEMGQIIRK